MNKFRTVTQVEAEARLIRDARFEARMDKADALKLRQVEALEKLVVLLGRIVSLPTPRTHIGMRQNGLTD